MKKIFLVCIILMVLIGCKKQVVKVAPSISSVTSTSSISGTTATIGGSISADGGDPITARGVVYGLSPNPTISDNKTSAGSGIGTFSSIISGLTPGQTYYFRTFATNSVGTSYGDQITFTSPAVLSSVTTTAATAITSMSATSGGNVTSDGGSPITARGVCWGTAANPTVALATKTTDGTGIGSFTSAITGLTPGVTYYARAYATNAIGTSYGDQITIAATAVMATITTTAATLITTSTASSGGNITADGGAAVTARGVCWSTTSTPTTANSFTSNGTGTGSFIGLLTNLIPGTIYYIRAYATNSSGTVYGTAVSFTTTPSVTIPILTTTTALSNITMTTAATGGTITSDGGASTTARGVCWNTSQNPTTANFKTNENTGVGSFTSIITCLTPNTTYYVRAYATNSIGTVYGSELTFTTQQVSQLTVTDIDGNLYHTVTIGTQVWMVENLKTTKYRNGDAIGTTTPASLNLLSESRPKYQWAYGGNESNVATYGRLYTWNAVNDSRNIAPTGWHVPTDAEWTILINYLGGESVAGGKLKQTCSTLWSSPNLGSTNETGFTAVGGGERWEDGTFNGINYYGFWWSSTENSPSYIAAWYRSIGPNRDVFRSDNSWSRGYSVRCILGELTQPTVTAPTVTTTAITNLTATSAVSGGTVSSDGGATVTARGVCWSTSSTPTISNNTTSNGTGTGSFTSTITGLVANTIYYVRAYATNSAGTAYGSEVTISTYTMAVVNTSAVTAITSTTATCGGTITSGLAMVIANGVCWSTSQNPTIANSKTTNSTGNTSFTSSITGLTAGTTYYVRAYATNGGGTAYGSQITFTTLSSGIVPPTLTTSTVTSITTTTATGGGNISSDGGASVTARGICYSINQNPNIVDNGYYTSGTGTGAFLCNLIGLGAGTTYYVRAYATNSAGTAYGTQVSFTTTSSGILAPTLTTTAISAITSTTATSGGNISSDGGASVTARGVCWSTTSTPTTANSKSTDGTGTGGFTSTLISLSANTTYYVRAYATNSAGTAYGTQVTFTTLQVSGSTVTDLDGNVYNTVTIGTQVWMASNLKTTKYKDGTTIPLVTDEAAWIALSTPGYCWYDNDAATYIATYGPLYNGYTVNTGKLCPTGWHVPGDTEWTTLTTYLGGESVAGGKLKETGTTDWLSPNGGATNETGFSALPSGYRDINGTFDKIGYNGYWWSSTDGSTATARNRSMGYNSSNVGRGNDYKRNGFSVRCLKD